MVSDAKCEDGDFLPIGENCLPGMLFGSIAGDLEEESWENRLRPSDSSCESTYGRFAIEALRSNGM